MKFALFYHSVRSDWNHGNAHFLRGMARALCARGHTVQIYEPRDGWSLSCLLEEQGARALQPFAEAFPDIRWQAYDLATFDVDAALENVDVAIVHEWNAPELIATLGRYRVHHQRLRLLFHDTHHRMVSEPASMRALDLDGYDGVLAFGEVLADAWRRVGWGSCAHVWHEAADVSTYFPRPAAPEHDVVWIGNWGDGEREQELYDFLLEPVRRTGASLVVHGVRYPAAACAALAAAGAAFKGWIAGPQVPAAFARARLTVHVPRRWYRECLVGIPTIRVFEALACGIPLISAPWRDAEGLFAAGEDYVVAADGAAMVRHLRRLLADPDERAALARSGRERILARHTCAHRACELEDIVAGLHAAPRERAQA